MTLLQHHSCGYHCSYRGVFLDRTPRVNRLCGANSVIPPVERFAELLFWIVPLRTGMGEDRWNHSRAIRGKNANAIDDS